jgi:hypothetical protein
LKAEEKKQRITSAMRLFRRRYCPLLGPCLGAAIFSSCSHFETVNVEARVLELKGEANRVLGSENESHAISPETALAAGDHIQIARGSELVLSLVPGIRISVNGDSEFVIEQLTICKHGHETDDEMRWRQARIRFLHGSLSAAIKKVHRQRPTALIVETPGYSLRAGRGAIFFLSAEHAATHFVVMAGKAHAEKTSVTGGSVTVDAGYEWTGGPAGVNQQIAVSPSSSARREGEVAAAAAIRSAKLEKAWQNAVPNLARH